MKKNYIWFLLLAGFFIRVLAFNYIDFSFGYDVQTFQLWGIQLFENGFSAFFSSESFSDYPPVYMYVLYALGALRAAVQSVLCTEYWQLGSKAFNFFTFLPAILCDIASGFAIYKLAEKKDTKFALFVSAAWLFNPAIILISSVWGQVESVFALILLVSLIFVRKKKLIPAYILFGIAILTKPQSLFLAPVYLYSAFDYLQTKKFNGESIRDVTLGIGAGLLAMVAVSLPFGLEATVRQMLDGMNMYNYASVNAFNFWALPEIGGGYPADGFIDIETLFLGISYKHWGIGIVLVIIAGALAALHVDKKRNDSKHFYLIVAALFIVIFTFSVKMHERYLFPALLFLLIYYAENRERREFIFYWAFSAVYFLNCLEVLRWANGVYEWAHFSDSSVAVVPFVTVFLAVLIIFILIRGLIGKPKTLETLPPDRLKNPPPMTKRDYAFIAALIVFYGVLAFIKLGDTRAPQTAWVSDGNVATVDFGEMTHITQFQYLMGARHDIAFGIKASDDGEVWYNVYSSNRNDVFAWHFVPLDINARYISLGADNGLYLQEIAFRGTDGEILEIAAHTQGAKNLVDEQHLVPDHRNFMNSTYFDEIYHPRTGYEFANEIWVYETTHPPLGKVLMAASIKTLGMTPFAWRLPGTLFGILMIPLIYAFARMLLKSNHYALFAAFIFTFDFMLYSHTRLATIDTFITFFVIAMYFLMYCYLHGIEKNTLKKSLTLLALCGVATGLAIASKWQGVYAAVGLPILFFPALYKLFLREKRQAIITFVSCFGFFVAIPIVIYLLSYIPFVNAQGIPPDSSWLKVVWDNQLSMYDYHSVGVLGNTHDYASQWWSWPLMKVPLWQYQSIIGESTRQGMSSFGNPAVWWFGIFATGFAIYSLAKKRRYESDTLFLLVAYAANFLPWIFVARLTYIYHYFPSVPFIVLLIVMFFKNNIKRDYICFAYAGLVFALFVLFFPVLSGMTVSNEFVQSLRWFPKWIFA